VYNTLRDTVIVPLYAHVIALQHQSLQQSPSAFVSIDGWTSPGRVSLIGISYGWVTATFERHIALLDLVQVDGTHNGPYCNRFPRVLILLPGPHLKGIVDVQVQKHLGPHQLLSAVCADNEPNMQKAGQLLTHGENYGCAAHTAQLLTGDVIQRHLMPITERCRVRMGFFGSLTHMCCRHLSHSFVARPRMQLHYGTSNKDVRCSFFSTGTLAGTARLTCWSASRSCCLPSAS
jgi:hypothetical protein